MTKEHYQAARTDKASDADESVEIQSHEMASYRLAAIVESAEDAIISMTLDGIITSWNKGAENLFGYGEEEAVAKPCSMLIPHGHYAEEPEALSRIKAGEHVEHYETLRIRKDGRLINVSITISPIKDAGGNIIGASKIARDITNLKKAEERLRESEARFAKAFNASPLALTISSLDTGKLIEVNQTFVNITGYSREEALGRTTIELGLWADPQAREAEMETVRQLGQIRNAEYLFRMRNGAEIVGLLSAEEIEIEGRAYALTVIQDITERKRAEAALNESEEKYRSLLENANDLIYSHDLQGNYLTINRACEMITGYTREEILGGLNIAQVIVPEHLELAKRMTALKLQDPTPTIYEIDIVTKHGQRLTLEVSTRISKRDGQDAIVEGIARDITDRKRNEIEREEQYRREQQARREAEEALNVARSIENSLGVLVEASGVLLGSLTLEDVQPAILDLARRLISADAYAIWRGDPKAKLWRIVSSDGLSKEYREQTIEDWQPGNFVFDKPVIAEDIEQIELLESRRALYKSEGIRSLLAFPMRIHGETSGTLTYYYRKPHRFTDREMRVATALANLSSAAINSAELYDEQRSLRSEAQASEWRSSFLAEASGLLSSTLDYEATLARVARLSVPVLADWCAVDILEEDKEVRRLAVAHVDPAKVEWAHEIQKRYPPDMDAPRGVPQVLRTGVSEIYPEITDEMLAEAALDEEHLLLLRTLGFSSAMIVPLLAHGRTLGVVTFITAESGRRYGSQDMALAEDLARRAAVAVENSRLYQTVQKANRLKDEFLATVSHELRTPLTAILGWAHLLRANQLDESGAVRALETIERNARAQSQLIDDLLDVSRIITGKLRLDVRQVDPGSFIQAAIDSLRPAADAKGVRIQKVVDTGVTTVAGDPARLQQVIWNLLSNAIKFTDKGGRVQVRLERINSYIEIAVSDTGDGIATEFLPHVFERFRQADMGTTRQHGGLGLGLAIVRHLVELHGGTVQAESEGKGKGATFVVKLPVALIYQQSNSSERVHPAARDTLPSFDCPERLDGLKVLIVDDEADARDLLSVGLAQCGAEIRAVGSAQEALEAFEQEVPDLLISDIGMPLQDGYDLIKRVRSMPADKGGRVPAIALTAYARTEDRLQSLRSGYQMHVPKPVELAELITVAASLVSRGQ